MQYSTHYLTRFLDDDDSRRLLELLDGLPLAIAQAGAYLHQSGMHIKTYLEIYQQKEADVNEIIQQPDFELEGYPGYNIWTTWMISYEAVLRRDKYAARLLLFWSCCDRNDFRHELFSRVAKQTVIAQVLRQSLGDIAESQAAFFTATQLLRAYSMIEGAEQTQGYSMHAVVHRWAYLSQAQQERREMSLLALITIGIAVPTRDEHKSAQQQRRLLPHALACCEYIFGSSSSNRDAEARQEHSDRFWSNALVPREDILCAFRNIGVLYSDQNKFDGAGEMYLRALQGYEEALGAKHTSTLDTVNSLGNLYWSQGKLDAAEKMYMRALQGYEEALGDEIVKTYIPALNTMRNLGDLYSETRPDESRVMYAKALSGYTIVRGDSSDICLCLKRRLDALSIPLQQSITEAGIDTNPTGDNFSNKDKP